MRTNIFQKGIFLLLTVLLVLEIVAVMSMNQVSANGYDVSAVISYAKTYWSDYNPNYSNYNDIGGDCANFVSQCLHAGGLEMTDGWYWHSYSDRSASWVSCLSMYDYFEDAGYTIIENPSDSQVLAGNPVLYYNSAKERWSHAAICVGNNDSGTPLVAAHNNDYYGVNWKLGTSWSKRCTILINDQNPPSDLSISVDKECYAVGETVNFSFNSTNAAELYIPIDVDGIRKYFIDITGNSNYSCTFDEPGIYSYYLYGTNAYGECETKCAIFTVYEKLKGDLNQDGNITLPDLIPLQKYLLRQTALTAEQSALADLNGDDMINVIDLMLLKRTILTVS